MEEQALLSPSYPTSCSGHLRSSLLSRRRERKLKDATILFNRRGRSCESSSHSLGGGGATDESEKGPQADPGATPSGTLDSQHQAPCVLGLRFLPCAQAPCHPAWPGCVCVIGGERGVLQGTRIISSIRNVLFQGN